MENQLLVTPSNISILILITPKVLTSSTSKKNCHLRYVLEVEQSVMATSIKILQFFMCVVESERGKMKPDSGNHSKV